jgi:hypothetical protein
VSERRNLEYVTKTGRGAIHTRPVTDAYREGWERTFRKKPKKHAVKHPDNRSLESSCGET